MTQASRRADEIFKSLKSWWTMHHGFGLAYIFSTDLVSMTWLGRRVEEELPTKFSTSVDLNFLSLFDNSYRETIAIAVASAMPRTLFWIAPGKDDLHFCLQMLNENRQALISSGHLFVLWIDQTEINEVDALAPDLWSVRSWVHFAGRSADQTIPISTELTNGWSSRLANVPASHSAQSPAIQSWTTSYAQWLAAASQNQKRLSPSLARHASREAVQLRQFGLARDLLQQSAQVALIQKQAVEQAHALQALGDLQRRLGAVDEARALYMQAIGLYEKEQADLGRANALQALGDLQSRLGAVDEARALYMQAIGLYEKEQDEMGLAYSHAELAVLHPRESNEATHHTRLAHLHAAQSQLPPVIAWVKQHLQDVLDISSTTDSHYL